MPVPKKRTSPRKKHQRRSHHGLKTPNLIRCKNCSAPTRPHRACPQCGYFKGKEIVPTEA